MHIMYVDESGDPGLPRMGRRGKGTNFFVLLGLIVAYRDVQKIAKALDDIWQSYPPLSPASRRELKRRLLFRGDAPFDRMTEAERQQLDNDIFSLLCKPPGSVTLIAVVVDKTRHAGRYQVPRRPDLFPASIGSEPEIGEH